jgi:2-polyprenyl-3-methyl-5-hydroxy-6-metoxy-1,4-benzoquinol methylase
MDARLEHEIEHGKYLLAHGAGEVWNWETSAGKLRWQRRVEMLTRHLVAGARVLELGCGTGYFTRSLAKSGATITAIDISPDLLESAKQQIPAPNVRFELENAYAMSFPADSFDSVVGSSVLHHLDVEKAVAEIHRVLKPSGSIYFTEPNMMNPQIAVQKNIPSIKKHMGDSPDETAFFRWSLKAQLVNAGFRDVEITPFDFLHPRIPEGWISSVQSLGKVLESLPVLSEIAGSLYIRAKK